MDERRLVHTRRSERNLLGQRTVVLRCAICVLTPVCDDRAQFELRDNGIGFRAARRPFQFWESRSSFVDHNEPVPSPEICVPAEVDQGSADAIRSHLARLRAAQERNDLPDVVGCAKEVAESVARVVLAARGRVLSNSASFKELISEAHRLLDRQPGEGIAADPSVRKMAQSAKGLVEELGQLRNDVGTGHGRASKPTVLVEHAEIATDAVTVWARWALRCLPAFLNSDLNDLLQLLQGGTFYKGTLRNRLEAIGLDTLDARDSHALDLAIGRRTISETFMVRIEGVDPAIAQPGQFSTEFRSGLIEGLLFDVNGALSTTPHGVGLAVDLLLVDDDLPTRLNEIAPTISTAGWTAPYGSPPPTLETVSAAADSASSRFPAGVRDQWRDAWER